MKTLVNVINEAEQKIRKADGTLVTYDSKRVRRADSMEYYKTLAVRYLDALGGETKMKSIINETVTKVNTILSHISKLQIEGCDDLNFCEFLNGQALGRIFENVLADKIDKGTPNGFSFKQGTEASFDKDINCESIPRGFALLDDITDIDLIEYMKEHWSGVGKTDKDFFKLPKYFGIELKTSQSKGATGNKSYANAEHSENAKSKSAFYIIINYDKPSAPNYTVNNVHAYFGFLDQMDWVFYADKSGTAKINNNLLKTRFIQIY